jgi:hypothetical protein
VPEVTERRRLECVPDRRPLAAPSSCGTRHRNQPHGVEGKLAARKGSPPALGFPACAPQYRPLMGPATQYPALPVEPDAAVVPRENVVEVDPRLTRATYRVPRANPRLGGGSARPLTTFAKRPRTPPKARRADQSMT